MNELRGSVLVTGGTGSFGKRLLSRLLSQSQPPDRIVIFSRDELKQWELQKKYPCDKYPQIRFFLGDIRDRERLTRALAGIDTVIHAAALKQVPAAEYNPLEYIKTNVIGADNLIQACLDTSVERVVALSTDKAAAPVNLYGATKLCSDKLFIAANNIIGSRKLRFSVVRYGNVMGSRGSVIPYFIEQAPSGTLNITSSEMTRFNISLDESVDMVLWASENLVGGEIFIPKIPSYNICDLATAIAPSASINIIGIRPGEKIHEEMITSSDSYSTYDLGTYFAIFPSDGRLLSRYTGQYKILTPFPRGESYNSGSNNSFLSIDEIRQLIKKNIDNDFRPF